MILISKLIKIRALYVSSDFFIYKYKEYQVFSMPQVKEIFILIDLYEV